MSEAAPWNIAEPSEGVGGVYTRGWLFGGVRPPFHPSVKTLSGKLEAFFIGFRLNMSNKFDTDT
jgi:hypothetical protein